MPENKAIYPPFKAVMFFDSMSAADGYDSQVFLHDSANGVTRSSFRSYLARVSRPHDEAYKLMKLYPEKTDGDKRLMADIEYIKENAMEDALGPGKADVKCKLDMAFRSVWYAATDGEELMPL